MVFQRLKAKYVTNLLKKLMKAPVRAYPKCGQSTPVDSLVMYYFMCLITWTINSKIDSQNYIAALDVGCLILDFIYLPDVECAVCKLGDKRIGMATAISPKFLFIKKLRMKIERFKNISLPISRTKIAKKTTKFERRLYQYLDEICLCKEDEVNEVVRFGAVDKKLVIL